MTSLLKLASIERYRYPQAIPPCAFHDFSRRRHSTTRTRRPSRRIRRVFHFASSSKGLRRGSKNLVCILLSREQSAKGKKNGPIDLESEISRSICVPGHRTDTMVPKSERGSHFPRMASSPEEKSVDLFPVCES